MLLRGAQLYGSTVDLWFGLHMLLCIAVLFTKLQDTELLKRFEAEKSEVSKFAKKLRDRSCKSSMEKKHTLLSVERIMNHSTFIVLAMPKTSYVRPSETTECQN